ncbi:phage tail spike protein [Eubacterium sp. 1001713B170207_170306_E7]|uniref:phage tail spike protein n=1 Tax=Eubacterium sp. 1001713B170207_170306_E7 TaxID=2787097 RepID=UPI00189C1E21|nr:phage tail spike protein [Eubacterium sp. 1001713B170207_170306_E7]
MFLQLYNRSHEKVAGLAVGGAAQIESVLSTGDKTLSFSYPLNQAAGLVNEAYLRTETDEFVIKEVLPDSSNAWVSVKAVLNVETLQGQCWPKFESVEQKIDDSLTLAIAGTGWTIGSCTVTKRRTIRKTGCSTWEIISQARKTYNCDIWFDSLEKKIHIAEKRGQDKGAYFTDNLNLKRLAIQSTSYDFCTRIRAEGKDGLTFADINGGKNYVENHQYSDKNLEIYWKDERYTVAESLKEDAEAKLNELSKPVVAYSGDILDLAKARPKTYRILDYGLGDTVELVDSTTGTKEKQRIVKIVEYPDEPEKNTCEFANRTASFEELQQEQNEVNSTVNNITADDGTISPSALDLDAITIHVQNIYAQELNAVKARIGELETTTLKATEAIINTAKIEELLAGKATILDLNALTARVEVAEIKVGYVDTLVSDVADIKTLVNGNLTSVNIQAGGITSDSLTIRNGFITNAMIGSVEAGKITTGILNTSLVTVQGADGRMAIKDNTIQIKDASRVRVQIGKDAAGDYSMYVWDANGALMFDAAGLHAPGIKSGIIRNDMVADNAGIAGTKIDIVSLITSINGNTTKIDSTVIKMDSSGQTLNLAFNTLKTTAETAKSTTETHTTQINAINGKIDTLIQDTTIIKDGQTVKLKDEYNKTVATVGGIQTTIGNQQTTIANLTNDLNNLSIGGRNYILNTAFLEGTTGFLPNQSVALSIIKEGEKDVLKVVSSQGSSTPGIRFSITLEEGGKYLLSFIGKGIGQAGGSMALYNEQLTEYYDAQTYSISTTAYTRQKTVLNVPKAGKYYIVICWSANGTERGLLFQNSSLKFEKGTKPTDWTPAPEDAQGQITEVKTQQATFQQTLNGFSTTVSSLQTAVNSKADGSTVNTLSNRITAMETNLDGFKTTVSSTYQTKNIPDTRNTNQPPSWYFANYPRQTATEFKNRSILGAPGGATYGTLTTHISWGDKSGGYPTQVFKSSDGTFERIGTSDSAWSAWKQVEDTAGAQNKADTVKNYVLANYSTTTAMNSAIDQKANQITLSVSQTYTTKTEFNNSAVKQFNNFSRTGNLTGWSPAANASGLNGVKLQTNSTYNWVGAVTTSGNVEIYSDFYEVDANKSYKLGLTINKPAATGQIYFGITCYNASKQAVGVYTGTSTTLNTNFYYYATSAVIGGWLNLEGYLMASNIDRAKLPAGKNVSLCAVMHPTTKYVRIRFLNYYNSGTSSTMYFAHPFIMDAENSQGLIETRVSTAEQKLTATSLITTITTGINGGTKFTTTKFTMDNTGLTIKGGGLRIQNNAGTNVLWADTNGNLQQRGDFYNYDSAGKLRASMTNSAVNFYDTNGTFISNMGATYMGTNTSNKGIRFYTSNEGKYFSWSFENSATPGSAAVGMLYAKEDVSGWTKGLHIEDSLYVQNGTKISCNASEYIIMNTPGYGNFNCIGNLLLRSDGYISLGTKTSNTLLLRANNDEVRMFRNIFMNDHSSIMHIGAACDLYNVGTSDFFIRNSNNLHICCNSGVSINNYGNSGWTEVRASNFSSVSQERYKTNIREYTGVLSIMRHSRIYEYNLKTDLERGIVNKNYGFIIERETPEQVTDHDNIAINLYSMAGINWQATKEIIQENDLRDAKIEHLQREIGELKSKIWQLEQRLSVA